MKYAELQRMRDEALYGFYADIVDYILDTMNEDGEIDQETFEERLSEELDSYFTYYDDAWEYLQDNNITDFEDAFYEWNVTGICGIACYYAYHDVIDIVYQYWDEYEDSLESEEDEDIE